MSRSGYIDDYDDEGRLAMYRGVVASATRGKRGQRFFRDLVAALEAMPVKRLVANVLETPEGDVCALGCVARARGVEMPALPEYTYDIDHESINRTIGERLDIAHQLAAETAYMNDEGWGYHQGTGWNMSTDEQRYERMLKWAREQVKP